MGKKAPKHKTAAKRDGLTLRQAQFVREYLVDLNATDATIRAGYSKRTAAVQGCRLLRNDQIQAAVSAETSKRMARVELNADDILREVRRIAMCDTRKFFDKDGNLRPIHELDDDTAAALAGVDVIESRQSIRKVKDPDEGEDQLVKEIEQTKKIRLWDKNSALEKAMKHLGLLKDRLEVTGKNGGPVQSQVVPLTAKEAYELMLDKPLR